MSKLRALRTGLRARFAGLPLLTMALNLALMATIFVTRKRWEAWVVYETSGTHSYSLPAALEPTEDPTGRDRIVGLQDDHTGHVLEGDWTRPIVLKGHSDGLTGSAFSRDGKKIVTASVDGTARIWEADTGRCLLVLDGRAGGVETGAFSSDGKLVATRHYADRTIRVWDTSTGEELALMRGHTDSPRTAYFSPDVGRVVSSSGDGTARVWDARSGGSLAVMRGHDGELWDARFSPDGGKVVTGSLDGTARVWDAASGACLAVLRHGRARLVGTAGFWPDDGHILTMTSDTVRRWRRIRPEQWWGIFWLPHFWLIAALAVALVASGWRDLRRVRRAQ